MSALGRSIDKIVDQIYRAAVNPDDWPEVLDLIASDSSAAGAALIPVTGRQHGIYHSFNLKEAFDAYISEGWYFNDPREKAIPLFAKKCVVDDYDIYSDREMESLSFYTDLLPKYDTGYFAGIRVYGGNFNLVLSVYNGRGRKRFSDEAKFRFAHLSEHLVRAIELSQLIREQRVSDAWDFLEKPSTGVIPMDIQGNVLEINDHARSMLGMGIDIIGRRVVFSDMATGRQFMRLWESMSSVSGKSEKPAGRPFVLVSRGEGRLPLRLELIPLAKGIEHIFHSAMYLIVLRDAERQTNVPLQALRCFYNLTPAEAVLAGQISQGKSLAECAQVSGITIGTVRQRLKDVFAKTNTHSQAQLAVLVRNFT